MLASVTTLPVIGVPVPLARLDGLDSLLSIVQMPAGIPVATVSIGGAHNAGLLAARWVGAFPPGTAGRSSDLLEGTVEGAGATGRTTGSCPAPWSAGRLTPAG